MDLRTAFGFLAWCGMLMASATAQASILKLDGTFTGFFVSGTPYSVLTGSWSAQVDTGGARQGSCRLVHAASGCVSTHPERVLTTASRSGFRVTAAMGVQLRVTPDQRRG
ncbi:hypothetical protein, partial [Azohydromonas sediminis]|uniref:hypothetical protein n=1 Tax=Azohydromonas sediminis TaxID=2259674 RepID=UPI0013C328B7